MSPPTSSSFLRPARGPWSCLVAALLLATTSLEAQIKSPTERIKDLEDSNEELRRRLDEIEKDLQKAKKESKDEKKKDEPLYSDGVLTLGGVKLEFGGKAEFLLVDPQSESDPVVGETDSPDPYFDVDKLRLEPRLLFSKTISVESMLDFKPLFDPNDADILLRELYARYNTRRPVWWFNLDARLGLEDRFIEQTRRTKYYPFTGNAFWRRESALFMFMATFGDKDGKPEGGKKKSESRSARLVDDAGTESFRTPMPAEGAGEDEVSNQPEGPVVVKRKDPFDLGRNPGEVSLYFSIGNGYSLGSNEIGQDGAHFNDMIVDDRDLSGNLSIRDLGFGVEYRRDFESSWSSSL